MEKMRLEWVRCDFSSRLIGLHRKGWFCSRLLIGVPSWTNFKCVFLSPISIYSVIESTVMRAMWRVVHRSTRICLFDIWARKVSAAWQKTARVINSRLNRLKVDAVRVAKKIKISDLVDNVKLNNKGYAELMKMIL